MWFAVRASSSTYASSTAYAGSWPRAYSQSRFAHLVYDSPTLATLNLAKLRHVGHVYVTDSTLAANPWDELPSYWKDEQLALAEPPSPPPPAELTGSAAAGGSTLGALTAMSKVVGSAAATAVTTGALKAPPVLSGSTVATATALASLTAMSKITAAAAATALATGALKAPPVLSGSAPATGAATGVLLDPGRPVSSLVESFSTLNGAEWGTFGVITPVIEAGRLKMVSGTSGTDYAGVYSLTANYNLTGDTIFIRPEQTMLTGSHELVFTYEGPSDNQIVIGVSGGWLFTRLRTTGSNNDAFVEPYSAATHAYWRLREAAGTVYWETSSNGLSWTTHRTVATPSWVGPTGRLVISAGHWQVEAASTVAYVDSINVAPASLTGSSGATGSAAAALAAASKIAASSAASGSTTGALTAALRLAASASASSNASGALRALSQLIASTAASSQSTGSPSASARIQGSSSAVSALSGAVSLPTPYPANVLLDAPTGYWRLGEIAPGFGTQANDRTGNGNHGSYGFSATSNVPADTTGGLVDDPDLAKTFDAGDGVTLPGALGTGLGVGDFTIEMVALADPTGTPNTFAVGAGQVASPTPVIGLQVALNAPVGWSFYVRGDTGVGEAGTIFHNQARDGLWHHVVGTRDGDVFTLYVDGQQVAQVTNSGIGAITLDTLNIGNLLRNSRALFWKGGIDEVAIYDYALDSSRIAAHYQAMTNSVPQEITASAAGSGSAIGALLVTPQMAGSSAAAAVLSGALRAIPQALGSSAAVSQASGSLKALPILSGSSAATGAASGSLAFDVQPAQLTGSTQATANALAALTATSLLLASTAAASATIGALRSVSQAVGTSVAQGTVTGQPKVTANPLGSASASGNATGAPSARSLVTGAANAASDIQGSIFVIPRLSGASNASSQSTGQLRAPPVLQGVAAALAATLASISVPGVASFMASASAQGGASAALRALAQLSANAHASASAQSQITANSLLQASAAASGLTNAQLAAVSRLIASTSAQGNTTGALIVLAQILGQAAAVSDALAVLSGQSQIIGTTGASGVINALPMTTPQLSGSASALAQALGALLLTAQITAANAHGQGSMAGVVRVGQLVNPTLIGGYVVVQRPNGKIEGQIDAGLVR
jgi:hypothetical protein